MNTIEPKKLGKRRNLHTRKHPQYKPEAHDGLHCGDGYSPNATREDLEAAIRAELRTPMEEKQPMEVVVFTETFKGGHVIGPCFVKSGVQTFDDEGVMSQYYDLDVGNTAEKREFTVRINAKDLTFVGVMW
jgi:hypothetical protein